VDAEIKLGGEADVLGGEADVGVGMCMVFYVVAIVPHLLRYPRGAVSDFVPMCDRYVCFQVVHSMPIGWQPTGWIFVLEESCTIQYLFVLGRRLLGRVCLALGSEFLDGCTMH
jgi:hypothetical protein